MQNKLKDFNWKTTPGTARHSTARLGSARRGTTQEATATATATTTLSGALSGILSGPSVVPSGLWFLQLNSIVGGKAERTAGLQSGGAGQTLVDQVGAPTTKIDTQSGHTIMPCGRVGSASGWWECGVARSPLVRDTQRNTRIRYAIRQ